MQRSKAQSAKVQCSRAQYSKRSAQRRPDCGVLKFPSRLFGAGRARRAYCARRMAGAFAGRSTSKRGRARGFRRPPVLRRAARGRCAPLGDSERMRCAPGRPFGPARKIQNDAIALFKTSFAAFKSTAIALPPLSPLVPPHPPLHPPQSITVGVRPMPTTAEVILRQLLHPQMPSAVRPTARWKALSAFSVFAPKMPSSVRVE